MSQNPSAILFLAELRQEKAGQKYLMPNGENQALYRDNGYDILEELADSLNILQLWQLRLPQDEATIRCCDCLRIRIMEATDWVLKLRGWYPDTGRDLIPTERAVKQEEVGL